MNLLTTDMKKLYFHYLFPSLGSALVITIYSLVDTIAVGQYAGPTGAAAMAVVGPIWAMVISFGVLFGIGGAAMMSMRKGAGNTQEGNRYFTIALISAAIFSVFMWIFFACSIEGLLRFFGADETILPAANSYIFWIRISVPLFLLASTLSAFIRNDGRPALAMKAVIAGGLCNIAGDWFFVFPMDMGVSGAGLATMLGQTVQFLILLTHLKNKHCTLRFVKPRAFIKGLRDILLLGVSPFILDFTGGILICMFNIQIMRYLGADALSVYSIVCTCTALFQALFNGVGQTIQPIISTNLGAGKYARIQQVFRLSILTAGLMGLLLAASGVLFPTQLIRIFMTATEEVLQIGPFILRTYFCSYLLLGFNIVAGYYLQSIMCTKEATLLSLLRGFFLSGILILLLPLLFGPNMIWWTMLITEAVTMACAAYFCLHKARHSHETHLENEAGR